MSISTYIKNLGLCKKNAGHKKFYYHFLEFNVILIIVGDSLKNKNRNYCTTKRILVHQILKIWRK